MEPAQVLIPPYWERAKAELASRDEILARIIETHPGASLRRTGDPFMTLARAIVGQQISVKAADSVWSKLVTRLGEISPQAVLACPDLKACGLSGKKVEYLSDLARGFSCGRLAVGDWPEMNDEALIATLTSVRGIGRWTAEMFLIFQIQRPDVLPLDDLGLQKAIRLHYRGGEAVARRELLEIAAPWRPWRSVATWYLWRSLDPVPVEY